MGDQLLRDLLGDTGRFHVLRYLRRHRCSLKYQRQLICKDVRILGTRLHAKVMEIVAI